jgi:hypothetical protein
MADVTLIKDLALNMIMALDKTTPINDIIEGFEEALDTYALICTGNYKA